MNNFFGKILDGVVVCMANMHDTSLWFVYFPLVLWINETTKTHIIHS